MIALLQSSWVAALVGGVLYLVTTAALIQPRHFAAVRAAQAEIHYAPDDDPSWRFRNPEFDQLVAEVRRERETLAVREQALQELQARLEAERQELQTITQAVHQLQVEFDRGVIRFKQQEAENLKRQIKIMSNLSAEAAAGMVAEMPDDEAAKLLSLLKPDEVSPILDATVKSGPAGAKRAATLTEKMRRVLPAVAPATKPRG